MKHQLLYKDLAKYYDLIYTWKDYEKETATLIKLIEKYKLSKNSDLLEAACGTGNHLVHLQDKYKCSGFDLNQGSLDIAKAKLPKIKLIKADMTDFDLKKKYDIIVCLFSSIGYVKTYSNLKKAITCFSKHLKLGGVLIIEPWFSKEDFNIGSPHISVYEDNNIKISRASVSKIRGNLSVLDMHYLIAERDKEVTHFVDRHLMGMFDKTRFLNIMKRSGLRSKFLKNGLMKDRGLYIGVK
ncbi:MAG: class I SAM-dependent methyltransferase [Candidatus Delongbacteria bacterium]|jgi:ubiquinone/menaquinone biosynthesis C-methylase UbiE|nr:class I SAM-dependent methyltransferase [Candidatus Delongbacteria bacterium]